jgi:hypothetical protein
MTIIQNRRNTALLVVDVQNAVVERAHRRDAVIANILTACGESQALKGHDFSRAVSAAKSMRL